MFDRIDWIFILLFCFCYVIMFYFLSTVCEFFVVGRAYIPLWLWSEECFRILKKKKKKEKKLFWLISISTVFNFLDLGL